MTIVATHQPQYLPYLGYFHKILHCDIYVVLDNVQFQRRGFQNRNKIKTATGWQWLTVPVLQERQQRIDKVQINNKLPWRRKHWKSLVVNYGQSRYFGFYSEAFSEIYGRNWDSLLKLNMVFTEKVMDALRIETSIAYASDLDVTGAKSDLLVNICHALDADCYLSGPGGRRYMDLKAFDRAGIRVIWQDFGPPSYPQLFRDVGFIPNLSVADALFNCGPSTRELIL